MTPDQNKDLFIRKAKLYLGTATALTISIFVVRGCYNWVGSNADNISVPYADTTSTPTPAANVVNSDSTVVDSSKIYNPNAARLDFRSENAKSVPSINYKPLPLNIPNKEEVVKKAQEEQDNKVLEDRSKRYNKETGEYNKDTKIPPAKYDENRIRKPLERRDTTKKVSQTSALDTILENGKPGFAEKAEKQSNFLSK